MRMRTCLVTHRARVLPALLASCIAVAITLPAPAPAQPSTASRAAPARTFPPDSAILAMIKQRVEEKRSAGIVVGVLDPDGRTRIVAFGDPGPARPPLDGNSVFEIGSISKVFTSTVLAQMVLEGKVKLEDPAQKFLPESVHLPTRSGKAITLGTLSMQNSGLPRMPSNFHPKDPANPYADYSVQQMYDFLSGYTLTRDPGAQFEYSNLGVGLLGHVLALASGKSYEQMELDRVWKPLGMTRTAITLSPWMRDHLALGHDAAGKVVPNWDLPTFAGAGAIRSTAVDMLKFVAANLHTDRGPLGKAMAFAHQERATAMGPTAGIGFNWIIQRAGTDTIIWHNGGTGGYRTFAGFEPSRGMGVVVLTNSGGVGADDIGMHLLNPALPLTPMPAAPKQRTAIALSDDLLAGYVGVYQLTPELSIEVTLKAGALYAQPTGQGALQLWAESATEFFLKEVDVQVTFVRDPQGALTGLVLHQGGKDTPGRKVK